MHKTPLNPTSPIHPLSPSYRPASSSHSLNPLSHLTPLFPPTDGTTLPASSTSQPTLSTHHINPPHQPALSTPFIPSYHPTRSTHPLFPPSQLLPSPSRRDDAACIKHLSLRADKSTSAQSILVIDSSTNRPLEILTPLPPFRLTIRTNSFFVYPFTYLKQIKITLLSAHCQSLLRLPVLPYLTHLSHLYLSPRSCYLPAYIPSQDDAARRSPSTITNSWQVTLSI